MTNAREPYKYVINGKQGICKRFFCCNERRNLNDNISKNRVRDNKNYSNVAGLFHNLESKVDLSYIIRIKH